MIVVINAIVIALLATQAAIAAPMGCIKSDGDWLDGVTRCECRSIGGSWESTYSPLDKPQKRKVRKKTRTKS